MSMLRTLEGVVCNEISGSLYAFPSIKLPRKAVEAAKVRRLKVLHYIPIKSSPHFVPCSQHFYIDIFATDLDFVLA